MGVAGAGKSTFAKKIQEENGGTIFSSDEIRKEFVRAGVIPKEYDSKYNAIVFSEMYRRIDESASKGENIIVDSTNVPDTAREPIMKIAKRYGYKVQGEILLLDDEECVRRILNRQAEDENSHFIKNPEEAVQIYKKRLLDGWPTLEEGFHVLNTYEAGKPVKRESKVLIASTNLGKIAIYAPTFEEYGISYCSLRDLQVGINPEETGETEEENAMIKAKAYHEATGLAVLCNDSGLVIEKFKKEDQPGVFVRRFQNRELSDKEMIEIFSQKLKEVGGESDAHFNVALVICDKAGEYHCRSFKSPRYMIAKPSKVVCKGLPLRSLDYSKKMKKYMSEMTVEEANLSEGECMLLQKQFIKECFSK